MVTIRTLLWGRRSSAAIALHTISSHFGKKLRGLECRNLNSSRPRLRPYPLHGEGSSSLLAPQRPLEHVFHSARKHKFVRIARMLESFRQQRAPCFSRILAKTSRNSFSGDEESMKHSEWFDDFLEELVRDTWTTFASGVPHNGSGAPTVKIFRVQSSQNKRPPLRGVLLFSETRLALLHIGLLG
jgi:hypothetical protein